MKGQASAPRVGSLADLSLRPRSCTGCDPDPQTTTGFLSGEESTDTSVIIHTTMRIFRIFAGVAALAANLPISCAFAPLLAPAAFGRRDSIGVQLRMGSGQQGMTRRSALESVGKLAIMLAAAPVPAMASKGEYARVCPRSGVGTRGSSSLETCSLFIFSCFTALNPGNPTYYE